MAWGRKKRGERKEPLFGLASAVADLRLTAQDRIAAIFDERLGKTTSKTAAKSKSTYDPDDEDEDPPPRERKTKSTSKSAANGAAKRKSGAHGRLSFGRLVY
jgi:hypothetical protein